MVEDADKRVLVELEKARYNGLTRENLFNLLPGTSYHEIEVLVKRLAKDEKIKLEWIGPNNFVILPPEEEDASPSEGVSADGVSKRVVPLEERENISDIANDPVENKMGGVVEETPAPVLHRTGKTVGEEGPRPQKDTEKGNREKTVASKDVAENAGEGEYALPYCPLLDRPCLGDECAIYIEGEGCSIAVIAVNALE